MNAALTEFLWARIAEDEALCEKYRVFEMPDRRREAECAAKRRIVARLEEKLRQMFADRTSEVPLTFEEWSETWPLSPTLVDLAAVYADHPEYRQVAARGGGS